MLILVKLLAVLAVMVILLRRKVEFGNAMLVATLLLFIFTAPHWNVIFPAVTRMVTKSGTWYMLLTLYFVMCLEYILRTSGILKDFTTAARRLFGSDRALLGFMPAFLGFLPSLGGAIFSAPLVKEAGRRYRLSAERLAAINYWFRHIWEFGNPIVPAVLLASQLLQIPVGTFIAHLSVFTVASAVIGIAVLLTGKAYRHPIDSDGGNQDSDGADGGAAGPHPEATTGNHTFRSIILAAGPILVNIFLVVVVKMNTALALALVLIAMAFILRLNLRKLKDIVLSSFSWRMHWGVINILFFQEALFGTGTLEQIIDIFNNSGIPTIVILSLTAFIVGLLVGSPQGFVAVTFPIIATIPNNMDFVLLTYAAGLCGTMCSPAHFCWIVTIDYFKADFLKALRPIVVMEIMMIVFAVAWIYFF